MADLALEALAVLVCRGLVASKLSREDLIAEPAHEALAVLGVLVPVKGSVVREGLLAEPAREALAVLVFLVLSTGTVGREGLIAEPALEVLAVLGFLVPVESTVGREGLRADPALEVLLAGELLFRQAFGCCEALGLLRLGFGLRCFGERPEVPSHALLLGARFPTRPPPALSLCLQSPHAC